MSKNQAEKSSLCKLVREIALLGCSDSIERFLCTVESFESNIQILEARVENIQQEIEVLTTQQ